MMKKKSKRRGYIRVRVTVYLIFFLLCLVALGLLAYPYVKEQLPLQSILEEKMNKGQAEEQTEETVKQSALMSLHHITTGWHTRSNKRCYYEKGQRITGWHMIDGKGYYFDEAGYLVTNQAVSKNLFVDKRGVLIPPNELYERGVEGLPDLKETLLSVTQNYRGIWSVYVKNLDTNEYLSINNQQIKPASLIKLYNMAFVFQRIEDGELEETKQIDSLLDSMITVSNNDSFNQLLSIHGSGDLLQGTRMLNEFCQEQGYSMTIASGTLRPSRFKDWWLCQSAGTVEDCGHILEDIYRECLVSRKASQRMLKLLKEQQKNDKIPRGLPEGTVCAHKTGEAQTREHDAAIVFSDGADYIITIMTMDDKVAIPHIQEVSKVVYEYFNE